MDYRVGLKCVNTLGIKTAQGDGNRKRLLTQFHKYQFSSSQQIIFFPRVMMSFYGIGAGLVN